jgi:glutaconyl-CoA/methylmalonyl-CoA decarboxylase subunit gamma
VKKYIMRVNGNEYEVEVEEVVNESEVSMPVVSNVEASSIKSESKPAPKTAKKDVAVPSGAVKITAPMPGTILKVNVSAGDSVKKGQVLLILEAMKMENEITAPNDGVIASVNIEKGSSVNVGDVMISIS